MTARIQFFDLKLWILSLFVFVSHFSNAQIEKNQTYSIPNVAGSVVTVGNPNAVATIQVPVPAVGAEKDSVVNASLILRVNNYTQVYAAPYDAEVKVSLKTWTNPTGTPATNIYTLKVKHQPFSASNYDVEDIRFFTDQSNRVYKMEATVTEVKINGVVTNTFPEKLYLETRIDYLRYNNFFPNVTSPLNVTLIGEDLDCNGVNESVKVSWATIGTATEYQIEWAFINDYHRNSTTATPVSKNQSDLKFDFKHNSTRVIKLEDGNFNTYHIPVVADKGYLVARVRAVGHNLTSLPLPIYGNWSAPLETGTVASLINGVSKIAITDHFEKNKNWQYSAAYAEEGKHKDVISYYDGSQRNRQTITQDNSTKTTIVGETIYDYTGRPAISILPAPLQHSLCVSNSNYDNSNGIYSFNYIPNINKAVGNYVDVNPHAYTKKDFDVVDPSQSCGVSTTPLINTSGASKYYSSNNPEKQNQQAFVPDANQYPFTQTEYTPDNTGRIRRKGGVGDQHQLGSDHETKYYYSIPSQVELDRLFGNEVGNAAHYQKNMVVDANGQVSISYLDMNGKTIATALAGSPPANLNPLSSQSGSSKNLTSDLFLKDYNGNSVLNAKNTLPDAIEFNSTFLVTENSVNTFTYNFSVDTVGNPCLKDNICFSCVYDLEIKVIDECGLVKYSSAQTTPNPSLSTGTKLVGNFVYTGGVLQFKTQCNSGSSSVFNYPNEVFSINPLTPGVYTISKTLRVNKEARDFYLSKFLDKTYNKCLQDFDDFLKIETDKIDTTDCFVSCKSCFAALGSKDDYVASGRGSELEWQALYDACYELCGNPKTKCEIAYSQMLADVSPNGQYGEIKLPGSMTLNAGAFALSVYNSSNLLPKNINSSVPTILTGILTTNSAHWKNPSATISGTTYNYYFDKNGQRSKVTLMSLPGGGYNLQVDNITLVYPTSTVGQYYTYPENLSRLEDFVLNWNPNWAKSLITYHPEYCYYQDCLETDRVLSGDTISSEQFDKKLLLAQTYNDAVASGLIISSGGVNILNYQSDPFVTNSTFGSYGAALANKYLNYNNSYGTNMSMSQFAASLAHCGMYYGQNPFTIPNCTTFGFPVVGPITVQDSVKNQEWNSLKNLYLSEKNKLQIQRSDAKRFDWSSSCVYYNGCIGKSEYNPSSTPMFSFNPNLPGFGGGPFGMFFFFKKPYFFGPQPCSVWMYDYYKTKTKRFGVSEDVKPLDYNQAAYQTYLQTGQCPNAFDMESLMNGMAQTGKLTAFAEPLVSHSQFTPNLYNYLNGTTTAPSTYLNYLWKATVTGSGLDINFFQTSSSTSKGTLHFDNPSSGTINWNNVKGIVQLQALGAASFKVTLKVQTSPGSSLSNIQTTGNTSIVLNGCKFKEECAANDFAKDLQRLLSALRTVPNTASPDIFSTSPIALNGSSSPYDFLMTSNIKNIIGSSASTNNYKWIKSATNTYNLYDANDLTCKLVIKFTGATPSSINLSTLAGIETFGGIKSDYQNFFVVDAIDASGNTVGTINGSVSKDCSGALAGISMGTCGLPDPITCNTQYHKTRKDLEALLIDVLVNKKHSPTSSSSISNVNSNTLFTNYLKGQVNSLNNPIGAYVVNSNAGYYMQTTPQIHPNYTNSGINNDSLTIPFSSDCKLTIKTNNKPGVTPLTLSQITSAENLTGYGSISNSGNYTNFYIVANFNTSNGSVQDTLFGGSCFDIQNCNTCGDTTKPCCQDVSEVLPCPTNGLVLCLPLNGVANDASGNNNNGQTLEIIPSTDRFGNPSSAVHFDGKGSYIKIPNSASISSVESTDELTITTWAKVNNWYQGWNVFPFMNKHNPVTDYGWDFELQNPSVASGTGMLFLPDYVNSPSTLVTSTVSATFGNWDFYAVTYSKSGGFSKLYKNGTLVNTVNNNHVPLENTGNGDLYIGFSIAGPDEYADGDLDEMKLFNRALSDQEILAIYKNVNCCPTTKGGEILLEDEIVFEDQQAINNGLAIVDNTVSEYVNYKIAVESLNDSLGYIPTDTNYIVASSYEEFANSGFKYAVATQKEYIKHFNPSIDNKEYVNDVRKFIKEYGHSTNPVHEYERYSKAIKRYNNKAIANNNIDTLTPIADTLFYKYNIADVSYQYVDYLESKSAVSGTSITPEIVFFSEKIDIQIINPDSCKKLYNNYVDAYNYFIDYQKANGFPCEAVIKTIPLYTYDEFVKNNYCCSNNALTIFNQYINSFYNTLTCPAPISVIRDCSNTVDVPVEVCAKNYNVYLDLIKKYNSSPYAIAHNAYLDNNLFLSFTEFYQAGYCNCLDGYLKSLGVYIDATEGGYYWSQPAPVNITDYEPCGPKPPVDECKKKYQEYLTAVTNYNAYAIEHKLPTVSVINKPELFTASGLCYCVDEYIKFLQAIMDGTIKDGGYIKEHLSLNRQCLPPKLPCPKPNTLDTLISPSFPPDRNPCVKYKMDLAKANATLAYQQYVNQLTTDFVKLYNEKCLRAKETFLRDYTESEFQHTLSYYDQAGNLIRTIPPAGIDMDLFNSITSISSATEIAIQQDRAFNTNKVTTNHNMATTYLYNSLNQLVRQYLPDHDAMSYTQYQYSWGLDTSINIVSSQFVSTNKGYVAGFKDISSIDNYNLGVKRGLIYETNDAGTSWQLVPKTVGSNLRKVQFIPGSNVGFAVGSDGAFMVSYDGGNNWDLVTLQNVTNNTNLLDLNFSPANGSVVEGFLVGEKGLTIKVKLQNGIAPVYSVVNTIVGGGTLSNIDVVTSVTNNKVGTANTFFISVLNASTQQTKIYQSNNTQTAWQDISLAQAPDLNKVYCLRNSTGNIYFVGGVDGTLLKFENNIWTKVNSANKGNIVDLYFYNASNGIAVIQDIANNTSGKLYKTTDGGKNWSLLDAGTSSSYYKSLHAYVRGSNSGNTDKLIACGTNGLLKRITINNTGSVVNIGAVNASISTTNDINDAVIGAYDSGSNEKYFAIAVGNNGAAYYCKDFKQNTVTWYQIAAVPTSVNAKKIAFIINTVPGNPGGPGVPATPATYKTNAILLNASGGLHFLTSSNSIDAASPMFAFGNLSSTNTYQDLNIKNYNVFNGQVSQVYLLEKTTSGNTKIGSVDLANASNNPLTSSSSINVIGGNIGGNNFTSFEIKPQDELMTVGIDGRIYYQTGVTLPTGPLPSWTDYSQSINLPKVNDLTIANTGSAAQLIAVGDNGLLATKDVSSSNVFKIKTTASTSNFNAAVNYSVAVPSYTGAVVGDNGYLASYVVNANQPATLNPIATGQSTNLNDVCVNVSSTINQAFAVGKNGKILSVNNFTTTTPVVNVINANTTNNLYGVTKMPSNNYMLLVGDNMQAFVASLNFAIKQPTWFINEPTKIHFANPLNGYIVGKKGLIRHTNDGCNTWSIVKSYMDAANANYLPDYSALYTVAPDIAVVGGSKQYLAQLNNNTLAAPNLYNYTLNSSINDIQFIGNNGYAVGYLAANGIGYKLTNTGTGLTVNPLSIPSAQASGVLFNAVHVFNNLNFITVSNNTKVVSYNSTTSSYATLSVPTTTIPANSVLNDVVFLDDNSGYIVGDKGLFVNINKYNTGAGTPTYLKLSILDKWIPTTPANYTSNVNIKTIAFSDRFDGFIGGNYNNGYKYARTFHDESGKFSTIFWYDKLGRMVLSQNSKQRNKPIKSYTYTLYDILGRVVENGEKLEETATSNRADNIFGTMISGYYNQSAIDNYKFNDWITVQPGVKQDVTKTYYDYQKNNILPTSYFKQQNILNEVASVTFEKKFDNNDGTFDYGTHYSYDQHGTLQTVIQDNQALYKRGFLSMPQGGYYGYQAQRYKQLDYEYDLISEKVNQIVYQRGKPDAFYQRYHYDTDNKLQSVETSRNGILWETDAKYIYFDHGALARIELGKDKVQGIDYAYTIHGWPKGANSNLLNPLNDMGNDGGPTTIGGNSNPNNLISRDAFGFTLNHYLNDYTPIDPSKWTGVGANRYEANLTGSSLLAARNDLYSGNISSMQTTITDATNYTSQTTAQTQVPLAVGNAYKYDQLNRLVETNSFNNLQASNTWASNGGQANLYKNKFEYDVNGNITTQKRYNANGAIFDDLAYKYYSSAGGRLQQNRLYHVNDDLTLNNVMTDDIDDQNADPSTPYNNVNPNTVATNNYGYDELGNLIRDNQEKISSIAWNLAGRIDSIVKTGNKPDIKFLYDGNARRIAKIEKTKNASGTLLPPNLWNYTYYVLNAEGQTMATYKNGPGATAVNLSFKLIERDIYGANRLGLDVNTYEFVAAPTFDPTYTQRTIGNKQYELINQLENVNSVVTDRKIPVDQNGDFVTDYYLPDVVSASDYFAYGSPMDARSFSSDKYRYGWGSMEKDDEIKGKGNSYTTLHRIYDARLGRWLSIDPESGEYPDESPYAGLENDPMNNSDPDGDCPWCIAFIKGAVQEYATQVITNFASGKDWKAAFTDVDGGAILESAVIDGVTMGIGSLVTKTKTVVKIVKATDKAIETEKAVLKTNKVVQNTEKIAKMEKNAVKATKKVDDAKTVTKKIANPGRTGKQAKLKELANDPKLGKADKGWIKQDMNEIKAGKRKNIRNPPGKDLAHERGRESAKGYSYKHSNLQNKADHKIQHKYDKNGTKNKERPVTTLKSKF